MRRSVIVYDKMIIYKEGFDDSMKKVWMKYVSLIMVMTLCIGLWSPVGITQVMATEIDEGVLQNHDEEDTTEAVQYTIVLLEDEVEIASVPALNQGESYQLHPRLKSDEQEYMDDVEFSFASSNEDVVSVSQDGLLEAKALAEQGRADITITCTHPDDGEEVVQGTFSVIVNPVAVTSVTVDRDAKTVVVNDTYAISATVLPAEASQEVIFESSDEQIATVSETGVVTALQEGEATISVISKVDETQKATVKIRVIDIPIALQLDKTAHSLKATDSFLLGAQLVYESGKTEKVDATQLSYVSSNGTVATVDAQGRVTALEQTVYPQTATIQVSYVFHYEIDGEVVSKQLTGNCLVTVTSIPVESIQLSNKETAVTLEINDTYTLLPKVLPSNATNQELTFKSSQSSVASVSSKGVITAKSIGETVITVAAKENSAICATFKVKVYQTVFNVAELGAKGTDTKSDATAINKVLAYADLIDEPIVVVVPNGTYYIDKILTIYSDTSLCLEKKAVIKRKASAGGKAMLRSSINSKIGGYDQCKNITITGGVWDGNANGSKDANCIYIGHAQNVVITDTTVKNNSGAHLIELAGVKNAIIENVELYGYKKCKEKGYTASQADKEAIQLDYCSSSSTPAMKPHDLTPCENVTIRKCNIHDYMSGIGSHGRLNDVYLKNIRIENNQFKNITNSCVTLMNYKNTTVSNNKASGFTTFLYASGSQGTIQNNTIQNKSFEKKTTSGLRAANGITVSNQSDFTVTKNKIEKATSNGITVWNGSKAVIKNNKIKNNKLYGIRTQGSIITLAKNTFSKNKKGLYDTYKDATVKSSDDIRAYYINIKKEYKYTGKKIKPKVKIKNLKKKYYKVSYKNNKKVGTATITIKGKGKVKGTLKKTFKIVKK